MKIESYTKIIFCIILVYCCFSIFNTPSLEEDSYIYFRFAENIASGYGYVFNQTGEKIEGCSSVTWLFLLVCFKLLRCNVLATAQLLGIFFGSCSLFIIYKICCCFIQLPRWRLMPVLLTAFSVPFLLRNQMGLEDPLYSFVFLSLVLVCLREKSFKYWPAVFFLLAITRPEGMFMAPALLPVFYLHRHRRREITRGIALVALLFILLFSLRIFYFHDFLPSSFYHKVTPDKWKGGLVYAAGFVTDYYIYCFFLPLLLFIFKKNNWSVQRLVVLGFIFVQCLWIILQGACFFPFYRHFIPVMPLVFIYVISGLLTLIPAGSRTIRAITFFCFCAYGLAALLLPAANWGLQRNPNFIAANLKSFASEPRHYSNRLQEKLLDNRYSHTHTLDGQTLTGMFIKNNYSSGTTFLYDQMGRLPYNAGPEYAFIDFLGLLDKTIGHILFYERSRPSSLLTAYYTLATAVISRLDPKNSFHVPQGMPESPYVQYVRKANPDVILCLAPMMYPALMELCKSPWFVKSYKPKYCLYWVLFFEKNGLATKKFNNPDNLPVMMENEIYTNFPDQCLVSAYIKAQQK